MTRFVCILKKKHEQKRNNVRQEIRKTILFLYLFVHNISILKELCDLGKLCLYQNFS